MQTVEEVRQFVQRYQTGGKTALQLQEALLKRIKENDYTDIFLREMTPDRARCILRQYKLVYNFRDRIDELVQFIVFMDFPCAIKIKNIFSSLDWDRIEQTILSLKEFDNE